MVATATTNNGQNSTMHALYKPEDTKSDINKYLIAGMFTLVTLIVVVIFIFQFAKRKLTTNIPLTMSEIPKNSDQTAMNSTLCRRWKVNRIGESSVRNKTAFDKKSTQESSQEKSDPNSSKEITNNARETTELSAHNTLHQTYDMRCKDINDKLGNKNSMKKKKKKKKRELEKKDFKINSKGRIKLRKSNKVFTVKVGRVVIAIATPSKTAKFLKEKAKKDKKRHSHKRLKKKRITD